MQPLGEFLRQHRDEILAVWLEQVCNLPSATGKPEAVLRDHMPQIVDGLANELDGEEPASTELHHLAAEHAVLRYREGYNLRQVFLEYQVLRRTIQQVYAKHDGQGNELRHLAILDHFVDTAIGDAVERYAVEHERSRDVFVAALGHDLRNPLHAILSAGMAISLGAGDVGASAELIVRSARRMDRLIADLLDFARARLGSGIPLSPGTHDLRVLVDGVVQEIATANPARSIGWVADPSGDYVGAWDGDRVVQAASNLLANAVEHGGDPIVIRVLDEGPWVTIEVRNRGAIPDPNVPLLFEPFRSGSTDAGNLGLGLYVVHEIAKAHSGGVEASNQGEEAVFRLVLPRSAEAAAGTRTR